LGRNNAGVITNSYAIGVPTGAAGAGGAGGIGGAGGAGNPVGGNGANGSIGTIGTANSGGIVGLHTAGTYTTNYWDTEISGKARGAGNGGSDPAGMTGKTTAQMKTRTTFSGWNFSSAIWSIVESLTYPYIIYEGAPYAPTGVSATSNTNTQSTVAWTAPAINGGSAITDYQVTVYNSSGGDPVGVTGDWTRNVSSTTTSFVFTGLTNGTVYTFKVRAINSLGTGSYSITSNTSTPSTLPGTPTSLAPTHGNAQVSLSWTAPASNGGSAIIDYIIEYKLSSEPTVWTTFVDGISTNLTATVTGFTNGLSYDFRVSAVNSVGAGTASSAATMTPATTPNAPTNVSATRGN